MSLALLPPDHPDRPRLADEVHARPSAPVAAPARASYVAVLVADERRADEQTHLEALCRHHGAAPPAPGQTQWAAALGVLRLQWERHGEFSSYTVIAAGPGRADDARPFDDTAAALLPAGWLAGVPGRTVAAVHARVAVGGADDAPDGAAIAAHFGEHVVVGARVADGAARVYTDFRIHADGFGRLLLWLDGAPAALPTGRLLQRLFEIEAYRMMALLALPLARQQWPRLQAVEATLAQLTAQIAEDSGADEALLQRLTALAAEVERALAASQFRFGAGRAYHALAATRIAELREQRLPGLQTLDEFMTRRLNPAMATCATVSQRLHDLSERVAQASSLLSTRVDIARQRQNQALLAATARRAQLQLRLQQTVEGLSVAAIAYYMAGLVGYAAKAAKAAGLPVSPDLVTGAALPLLAGLAWWTLRRVHHRIAHDDRGAAAAAGD